MPGAEPVALLGHALWRERFGAEPGVVGRTVTLNGKPVAVAGVAPPGFRGLSGDADLWMPVHPAAGLVAPFLVSGGQAHWLQAVGRLRPEASLEALQGQMGAVGEAAEAAYPDSDPTVIRSGGARSLLDARMHPQARRSLLVLSAAAMLLLLVACTNLAGLFLARAGARTRETAVRIALGASRWWEDPAAFHQGYLERLRALPEVASASVGCSVPLGGHCMITRVRQAGGTVYPEGSRPEIGVEPVDPDFFDTLGIPLLRGRGLGPRDRSGSPPVVVLNETAARRLFPGGDALGRKVQMGVDLTPQGSEGAEVVGVVEDVLYDTPEKGVMAEAYVSMYQEVGGSTVFLRTRGEPMALVAPARSLLARRTRELGLRVALGAVPGSVVALVVRQGLAPAVAGVLVGAGLAWAGGRALQGLLYQVSASDPATIAGAAVFLLAVSAVAAWLPARRATRVDPMEALRAE